MDVQNMRMPVARVEGDRSLLFNLNALQGPCSKIVQAYKAELISGYIERWMHVQLLVNSALKQYFFESMTETKK
jgi:hypothetical protein